MGQNSPITPPPPDPTPLLPPPESGLLHATQTKVGFFCLWLLFSLPSALAVPVARVFEANRGQAAPEVLLLSRGDGLELLLTSGGAMLRLHDAPPVRMKFLGASPASMPEGVETLRARINYFEGRDPSRWITDVPTYARARVRGAWPLIDVEYRAGLRDLEYDLVLKPGADLRRVRIRFEGATAMHLEANGDLVLATAAGDIRQHRPLALQDTQAGRKQIAAAFVLEGDRTVSFRVGAYDRRRPLRIDPVVTYSTRFGSASGGEQVHGMAVDGDGNTYLTGQTADAPQYALPDFPKTSLITGPAGASFQKVFVTKIARDGTLVYSTLIGGQGIDRGWAIAVDAAGNAYVAGETTGNNTFPVTLEAFQTTMPLGSGGFVLKLNPSGTRLVYSTYLGASYSVTCAGIAVDADGNAFVTGSTNAPDFPTTPGAFQRNLNGAAQPSYFYGDAFVTKLDRSGSSLIYSTLLGGAGSDYGHAISIDSSGNAYILGGAGGTSTVDFPVTPGSYRGISDPTHASFVAKLNPSGTGLVYSALVDPGLAAMAVDASGNAYLTGSTGAPPGKVAAVKLNAAGTGLLYSTAFGGSNGDAGYAIAADSSGTAYITGVVRSVDFPLTPDNSQPCWLLGGGGGFLAKLNAAGSPTSTTLLPGLAPPALIAVDSSATVYLAGNGASSGFPVTTNLFPGPAQGSIFLMKLAFPEQQPASGPALWCLASAASLVPSPVAPGELVALFGSGIGPEDAATAEWDSGGRLPTSLSGARVLIDGVPAPLLYVQSGQINAVVPYQVQGKPSVSLEVQYQGQTTATLRLPITPADPAFFSRSANGRGQGAILNQDGSLNSALNPARKGSIISLWGTGLGETDPPGIDGSRTGSPLPRQVLGLSVMFGYSDVTRDPRGELLYAGPAPDLVAGTFQVNVRIPDNAPSGDVPLGVFLVVDDTETLMRSHVTVAIQ